MKQQKAGGQSKEQSKSPVPLPYRPEQDKKDWPVTLLIASYANGNLVVVLQTDTEGVPQDFATITVNFPDEQLLPDQAYLDINNVPGIEQFVREHQLAKPNGREKISGYCTYPLYTFDLDRCMEHGSSVNPLVAS